MTLGRRASDNGVSLREFVEAIMDERDRRYEQRFQAQELAKDVAEDARDRVHRNTLWLIGVTLGLAVELVLHFIK